MATLRRPGHRWLVMAGVLLIVAAALLFQGLTPRRDPLAGPNTSPIVLPFSAATRTTPGSRPKPHRPIVARSSPVTLRIPAIGLTVAVSSLGLNPDGTVEVPTNFQEPGWYRFGPSPGQVGSAVILGHVDSYLGPAVFFQLRTLRAGDRVVVDLADGAVAQFVVDGVAMYSKTHFPDQAVYASHGYSALQLVTCGGVFDPQAGSYLSNVVAYTSLVAITPARLPRSLATVHSTSVELRATSASRG